MPAALDVLENRRLLHAQPDVEGDADEKDRDEKRNAPAPRAERFPAHHVLDQQNHGQRNEQSERCGDLNEAGVETALLIRHVLGDVYRGAAVFAAERQSLQDANHQQNDWRRNTDRRVRRQKTDQRRGATHDQQRDQERVLASHQIADAAKEKRAERAHHEADRESRQISDQRERVISLRIKQRRDDGRETSEDVEVVPLDHGTDRGRRDDFPDAVVGRCGPH